LFNGYNIVEMPVNLHTLCERYADTAIEFIGNMTNPAINPTKAPFFMYMAWAHMHKPITHDPKWTNITGKGVYHDALYELDWNLGRVVKYIETSSVADNTLIFITGDNGPALDQCAFGGSMGPFLGLWESKGPGGGGGTGKSTCWEGGHREVGLAYWPGVIKPRTTTALASTLDFFPTFVKLAGGQMPNNRSYDGIDISNVLFGGSDSGHESLMHPNSGTFGTIGDIAAVRAGKYKGHIYTGAGMTQCGGPPGNKQTHEPPLLFDLSVDIAEENPIGPKDPRYNDALNSVRQALVAFQEDLAKDHVSKANYGLDPKVQPCCNPKNPMCRCTCIH
jgi:arylsulfatase G